MTTLPVAGRERQRAMGEVPAGSPPDVETPSEIPHSQLEKGKEWHSYLTEDLPRTVLESTDSAIRSARSLQQNSSSHLRSLQDFLPHMRSQYKTYEDAFFKRAKDELVSASEHPAFAGGIALTAALLLMRGPRRFLFRHTLGRFQSEEAQFSRAEKSLKELNISIDLVKNESRKLLERAHLAEKEMREGHSELINAGRQIQGLAKSVYKAETQTSDLMDVLREIPGREALKLRAEVASLASFLRQQRRDMGKRIMKISDLGVPV